MKKNKIIYLLLLLIPINIFAAKAEINSLDWSIWDNFTSYSDEINVDIQAEKENAFSWFTVNQVYTNYNDNKNYTIKRMKEKHPDKPEDYFDEPRQEEEYLDDYIEIYFEEYILSNTFSEYYNYLWQYFYDLYYKEVDEKMDYYKTHFSEFVEDYLEPLFDDHSYEITELYGIGCSSWSGMTVYDFHKYDEAFEDFYITAYLFKEYPVNEENLEELANFHINLEIYNPGRVTDGRATGSIYLTGNGKDANDDNNIPINYWNKPDIYGIINTYKIGNHEEKIGCSDCSGRSDYYTYKYLTSTKNGFTFDRPNFGKLEISIKNITDTKVEVTYKLTNNSGTNTTYGLSNLMYNYINDTGDEYLVSTELKDDHYVVTNYYKESTNAYGAQLIITPNKPNARHLGDTFYTREDGIFAHHYLNRFNNSELTQSIDDFEGKELAFSWQGNIKNGETITHTVTYELVSSEDVEVEFNPIQGAKTTVQTIDGAALEIPSSSTEQGSNIKWYTNPEGTGKSYLPSELTLVHASTPKYYEIKKENTVVAEKNIVNPEVLKEELQEDLNTSNDDVKLVLNISSTNPELSEKLLINEKIKDTQTLGAYLDIDLFKIVNNSDKELIEETTNLLTIELTVPEQLLNTNKNTVRTYQVLRLHNGVVDVLDTQFINGKIVFKTNKFSTYTIIFADEIKNPQTGDNLTKYIIISLISLISISTSYYVLKHN